MIHAQKIGSLFAGVGLLELAVERAIGSATRWQVELDPWRRTLLARHYPAARRFADVRTVGAGELDLVDGIVGGFPCRGTSSAGPRTGLDHAESGLWREYRRILAELRPAWAFIENPSGLEHRGLAEILDDLDALGMHTRRGRLAACDVGGRHRRSRMWILAYADEDGLERLRTAHHHHRGDAQRDNDARRGARVLRPPGPRAPAQEWADYIGAGGSEPGVRRGAARGAGSLDSARRRQRLAALGDAVDVDQAAAAFVGLLSRS